jgi:hypothetical protein
MFGCCCNQGEHGFKSVLARKTWHGRTGFKEMELCPYRVASCSPSGTVSYVPYDPYLVKDRKFLKVRRISHATVDYSGYSEAISESPDPNDVCSNPVATSTWRFWAEIHIESEFLVDHLSGVKTLTDCDCWFRVNEKSYTDTGTVGGLTEWNGAAQVDALENNFFNPASPAQNGYETGGLHTCIGEYNIDAECGQITWGGLNMPWGLWTKTEDETTNTHIGYQRYSLRTDGGTSTDTRCPCPGDTCVELNNTSSLMESGYCSVDLSEPYTNAQLYSDWQDIIASLSLTDDSQLPWRSTANGDGDTTLARYLRRNESLYPVSPDTSDRNLVFYDPNGNWEDHIFQCVGYTVPNTAGYDGSIIGLDAENPIFETVDANLSYAYVRSDFEQITGVKWAERKERFPGQNFFRPCGADRAKTWGSAGYYQGVEHQWDDKVWPNAWSICGRAAVTETVDNQDGTVTVTLASPATGLQVDDTVLFTNVPNLQSAMVVTVNSTTSFVMSITAGSLGAMSVAGGYISSAGAPSYTLNHGASRGTYVISTNTYNAYDTTQNDSYRLLVLSNPDCAFDPVLPARIRLLPGSGLGSFPCAPSGLDWWPGDYLPGISRALAWRQFDEYSFNPESSLPVIAISPSGEAWPNGRTHAFPEYYAAWNSDSYAWHCMVIQRMADIFYVPGDDTYCLWGGTEGQAVDGMTVPWVEAFITLPSWAPALPAGQQDPPEPAVALAPYLVSEFYTPENFFWCTGAGLTRKALPRPLFPPSPSVDKPWDEV